MQRRDVRVAEEIKRIISSIIRNELKHPVELFSIPYVKLSKDLSHAKVFISVFGKYPEQDYEHIVSAKGFIRSSLSKQIRLRKVPELEFVHDHSLEDGSDIVDKINSLNIF